MLNEPNSKKPWQGDGCWRFAFARLLDLALVAPEQETILNEIVLHLFVSGCFRVLERKIKHARLACALAKPPDHAPAAPRPARLRMQCFHIGCVMVFFTRPKLVFSWIGSSNIHAYACQTYVHAWAFQTYTHVWGFRYGVPRMSWAILMRRARS